MCSGCFESQAFPKFQFTLIKDASRLEIQDLWLFLMVQKLFFYINFMGLVIYTDVSRSIIVTLLYLKSFLKFSS